MLQCDSNSTTTFLQLLPWEQGNLYEKSIFTSNVPFYSVLMSGCFPVFASSHFGKKAQVRLLTGSRLYTRWWSGNARKMGPGKLFEIIWSDLPPAPTLLHQQPRAQRRNVICWKSEPASAGAEAKVQWKGDVPIFSLELWVLHTRAAEGWGRQSEKGVGGIRFSWGKSAFHLLCALKRPQDDPFEETILLLKIGETPCTIPFCSFRHRV